MSQTNRSAAICNKCGDIVPIGQGAVRFWNGAARRYAPKYAKKGGMWNILNACLCVRCERERDEAAKMRAYNKRHGFTCQTR